MIDFFFLAYLLFLGIRYFLVFTVIVLYGIHNRVIVRLRLHLIRSI